MGLAKLFVINVPKFNPTGFAANPPMFFLQGFVLYAIYVLGYYTHLLV